MKPAGSSDRQEVRAVLSTPTMHHSRVGSSESSSPILSAPLAELWSPLCARSSIGSCSLELTKKSKTKSWMKVCCIALLFSIFHRNHTIYLRFSHARKSLFSFSRSDAVITNSLTPKPIKDAKWSYQGQESGNPSSQQDKCWTAR